MSCSRRSALQPDFKLNDTTKADAFIWRIRLDESNSCDHKLGNTRQDGDQVLCVILLCSYIHKTLKKVEVMKFSFEESFKD